MNQGSSPCRGSKRNNMARQQYGDGLDDAIKELKKKLYNEEDILSVMAINKLEKTIRDQKTRLDQYERFFAGLKALMPNDKSLIG